MTGTGKNTKPKLSVIIVSFNSADFISLCLDSLRSNEFRDFEIIVVDNNSRDTTAAIVQEFYPEIRFHGNSENLGFAKACNQGAAMACGSLLLFLNPDCILLPDCLELAISQFDSLSSCGAAGALMYDGQGEYLPVSSRYRPSVKGAIQRLIFSVKNSSRYHRPSNSEMAVEETEILTGAFLMISKRIFDALDGFDTDYFMYGEDIDLCERLLEAGYKNYLLKDVKIIHFKGESAPKNSLKYIRYFYSSAMLYVYKNKFGKISIINQLLSYVIILIIGLLKFILFVIKKIELIFISSFIFYFGVVFARKIWAKLYFNDMDYFIPVSDILLDSIYVSSAVLLLFTSGFFHNPSWHKSFLNYSLILLLGMAFIYALLPEEFRYSRMVWFSSVLFSFATFFLLRIMWKENLFDKIHSIRYIGRNTQFVQDIMNDLPAEIKWINSDFVSKLGVFNLHEAGNLNSLNFTKNRKEDLIGFIDSIPSTIVIGSREKCISRRISKWGIYRICDSDRRVQKRLFDIVIAITCLLNLRTILFSSKRFLYLSKVFQLLRGRISTVSYSNADAKELQLPGPERPGVLMIARGGSKSGVRPFTDLHEYCIHYHVIRDLECCIRNFGEFLKKLRTA